MHVTRFRDWTIRHDPYGTRQAYEKAQFSELSACCSTCENLGRIIHEDRLLPPEVSQLLADLAIDPSKVVEPLDWSDERPGLYLYSGWYFAVGEILDGPDSNVPTGVDSWNVELASITDTFSLGITRRVALAPPTFPDAPLVMLEFQAWLPWLLSTPYPGAPPAQHGLATADADLA
jgi:hypothetical protein